MVIYFGGGRRQGKSILASALSKLAEDKYTIDPFAYAVVTGSCGFMRGDTIDLVTGDIIVGEYCQWPKQERREFIVTDVQVDENPTSISIIAIDRAKEEPSFPRKERSYRDDDTPRSPMKRFRKSSKR